MSHNNAINAGKPIAHTQLFQSKKIMNFLLKALRKNTF